MSAGSGTSVASPARALSASAWLRPLGGLGPRLQLSPGQLGLVPFGGT
jgi:hypothetical protein